MPVYVTRAHVTIGDANKNNKKRRRVVPKRAFHVLDICKTPFCLRSCFVSMFGTAIVAGGLIMTIIGYKPSILLPWYDTGNYTQHTNNTNPTSVPNVLGEPGPLRVLVYIGPTLMGIGFFTMMITVVLFCEIKDRYFNNILPKPKVRDSKKEHLYDMIIEEFRKNYFRGIEVPLKKPPERPKSKRFSISLSSRTGSFMSFGRRLSHDIQKWRQTHSRECQSERVTSTELKRSPLRRILDTDTWMQTSSLPNITHKGSLSKINTIRNTDTSINQSPKRTSNSCGPHLNKVKISGEASGVDNLAYRESPPDTRNKAALTKYQSLGISLRNAHVTTVLIHRESNNEKHECSISSPSIEKQKHASVSERSKSDVAINIESEDSVIDIERDIKLIPKTKEDFRNNHFRNNVKTDINVNTKSMDDMCMCGTDVFCTAHALGMDSGGSSLSLSWDNVPCEWNDARRNTEPHVLYCTSFNADDGKKDDKDMNALQSKTVIPSNEDYKYVMKPESASSCGYFAFQKDVNSCGERKSYRTGPFKTSIGVFKSDSNLQRLGTYSLLRSFQKDSISLDSLELSDEMLKNFELTGTAYM